MYIYDEHHRLQHRLKPLRALGGDVVRGACMLSTLSRVGRVVESDYRLCVLAVA